MAKTDRSAGLDLLSEDEIRLWRSAMREVRPLPGRAVAPPPPPAPETAAVRPPADAVGMPRPGPSRQVPQPERQPARLSELKHGTTAGLDKRRGERLKRGQLAVEGRIDLHGLTQERARQALDAFVAASYATDRRVLLVITGKGIRPDAGRRTDAVGVLRQAVPKWLNEQPNRARVLAFTHARPRDGGTGALYVLLRRRRDGP